MRRVIAVLSLVVLVFTGSLFAAPSALACGGGCGCGHGEAAKDLSATAGHTDSGAVLMLTTSDPALAAALLAKMQDRAAAALSGEAVCSKASEHSPFHVPGIDIVVAEIEGGVVVSFDATTPESVAELQTRVSAMASMMNGEPGAGHGCGAAQPQGCGCGGKPEGAGGSAPQGCGHAK